MTYIEFLEAIARVSEIITEPDPDGAIFKTFGPEDPPLDEKIEQLLINLVPFSGVNQKRRR